MQEIEATGAHPQNPDLTVEQLNHQLHGFGNAITFACGSLSLFTGRFSDKSPRLAKLLNPIHVKLQNALYYKNLGSGLKFAEPLKHYLQAGKQEKILQSRLKRTIKKAYPARGDQPKRKELYRQVNEAQTSHDFSAIMWETTAHRLKSVLLLFDGQLETAPDEITNQQSGDLKTLRNSLNTSAEMAELFAVLSQPELLQERLGGLDKRVNQEGYEKIQRAFSHLNISVPDHPSANI